MKAFATIVASLFILSISSLFLAFTLNAPPRLEVTKTAQSAHQIKLYSPRKEAMFICSGTAIGTHAILTAEHCDEPLVEYVRIDRATHFYRVQSRITDDADHVIYLLDGPAFSVVEPYITRAPKLDEHVHIYGFGGYAYPANIKNGRIAPSDDPSSVDKDFKIFAFDAAVISGDSGAVIYGEDNAMLGVVSYSVSGWFRPTSGLGFELAFTPDQIEKALTYIPEKKTDTHVTVINNFGLNVFGLNAHVN